MCAINVFKMRDCCCWLEGWGYCASRRGAAMHGAATRCYAIQAELAERWQSRDLISRHSFLLALMKKLFFFRCEVQLQTITFCFMSLTTTLFTASSSKQSWALWAGWHGGSSSSAPCLACLSLLFSHSTPERRVLRSQIYVPTEEKVFFFKKNKKTWIGPQENWTY